MLTERMNPSPEAQSIGSASAADLSAMASQTAAIIVHFGDPNLTAAAIDSIMGPELHPGLVIVVDNGPGAPPQRRLSLAKRPVKILGSGQNIGFAQAVNLALQDLRPRPWRYAWLFNNDAVAMNDTFPELLGAMAATQGHGLVSSRVLDMTTRAVWFESAWFQPWRMEGPHRRVRNLHQYEIYRGKPSWIRVPYLPACSLLVPTDLLRELNGLNPRYFVYGEDVDLAIRALKRGYPLVVSSKSQALHRTSSGTSPREKRRMLAETSLRVTQQHFRWIVPLGLLGGTATGLYRAIRHRNAGLFLDRYAGYMRALRARPSEAS